MQTLQYGPAASQVGDLYRPDAPRPPVVCLLHGGFWRLPYGREELAPVAQDLVGRGWAVWNLEYRRVGEPGGGWPGTLLDVSAGLDHLAEVAAAGSSLDLGRVVVVGHSAGGHLAVWSAAAAPAHGPLQRLRQVRPRAVASLAGVLDLRATYALAAGNGTVADFIGGSPQQYPDRYAAASPLEHLPLGVSQLVLHGARDEALPVSIAQSYVAAAAHAGDPVAAPALPDAGHMDFLDPRSAAHAALCAWLDGPAVAGRGETPERGSPR